MVTEPRSANCALLDFLALSAFLPSRLFSFRIGVEERDFSSVEVCESSSRSIERTRAPQIVGNIVIVVFAFHLPQLPLEQESLGITHTRELDATVTALGSGTLLLDVKVTELTARGLDDPNLVGPRVVPVDEEKKIHQYSCPS